MRMFAIGDIHGCARTFRKLLDQLGLEPADRLFLLGDYIDRGPDSREVLETILRLQGAGYLVEPVLGNHERMLLDAVSGTARELWLYNGGRATLGSYGVDRPDAIPREHLDLLARLPLCRITEQHVFVHAGLDFSRRDPLTETDETFMLWSRPTGADPNRIGGRSVVVGHCVTSLPRIAESLKSGLIRLDNGCCLGTGSAETGNLVGLELRSGELFVQRYCE